MDFICTRSEGAINVQTKIYCGHPPSQFVSYKAEILAAISKIFEEGPYILGSEVAEFEKEFAAYHNVPYAVGVGSGTDALALTLKACGIGKNDEVITVSHTALATVAAIVMSGATPRLVDIEPIFYTLDPEKIEAAITKKTKAIIPVHIYGQPCEMESILKVAKKHDLLVIEDCAQAHGATYQGKKVGTLGHAGCFSFYPTKNLGAIGDGGAIITRSKDLENRLKRIRQYGWDEERVSQEPGVVSRLDSIQAAILRVKLKYLDEDNQKRNKVASYYSEYLKNFEFLLPMIRPGSHHAYHLYVIQANNREEIKEKLLKEGIEAGVHYAMPAHCHPGYKNLVVIDKEGLSVTENIIQNILSLPIYPEFSQNDMDRVITTIRADVAR